MIAELESGDLGEHPGLSQPRGGSERVENRRPPDSLGRERSVARIDRRGGDDRPPANRRVEMRICFAISFEWSRSHLHPDRPGRLDRSSGRPRADRTSPSRMRGRVGDVLDDVGERMTTDIFAISARVSKSGCAPTDRGRRSDVDADQFGWRQRLAMPKSWRMTPRSRPGPSPDVPLWTWWSSPRPCMRAGPRRPFSTARGRACRRRIRG